MILQRYILRELVFTFLFAFAAVMGVFLIGMSFQVFRSYSSIGLGTLLRIIPLAATNGASWAILVSVPCAVTLVYGRLSADNEIDAMRISGIATRRMVAPAILFSVLVSFGMYAVLDLASPQANYAKRMLIREFSIELLKSPPPGKQYFRFDNFELSYLDCTGNVMQMPYIALYVQTRLDTEYTAVTGRASIVDTPPTPAPNAEKSEGPTIQMTLEKWMAIQHDEKGRVTFASAENEYQVPLPLKDFMTSKPRPENLPSWELWKALRKLKPGHERNWLTTAYYSRFAQSLVPFFITLVSVPIGVFVRRGSRLAGLGAALPPLLIYIVAFFVFQGMGENGRIRPYVAAFAPDALLFLLGTVLLWRVCRK